MDANKLKVLQDIRYRINPTCETCAHSDLSADGWGYCGAHEYQHLKHSEETSPLSVHRLGWCARWELDDARLAALGLGAFREFAEAEMRREEGP
jgi:hypothetical protein